MTKNRLVIVDYGAGNLRSVVNAVRHVGAEPLVSSVGADIAQASAVILPGVGAAACVMQGLQERGLKDALLDFIVRDRPFLGICLGLQVLFETTDEGGGCECLGVVAGGVKKFTSGLKVPHMGWNQVRKHGAHPIFAGIDDRADFYFVHSYYSMPGDPMIVVGETDYGVSFCSALARGNLVATQFHPEKSGPNGLKIYTNFLKMAGMVC
ncbi:MAG: imidazole glycerol phosphate synthase subunit HisH [Dehalococcoidia bacterium]|nr:imidazole glycerol phosphate synthase subunit HisH [Dehalococcoidia bacterium]